MPEVFHVKSSEDINKPHEMEFEVTDVEKLIKERTRVIATDVDRGRKLAKAYIAHKHHLDGTKAGTDFMANAQADLIRPDYSEPTSGMNETENKNRDYESLLQEVRLLEASLAKFDLQGKARAAVEKRLDDLRRELEEKKQTEFEFSKKI